MNPLSPEYLEQFSRQLLVRGWSLSSQKLFEASIIAVSDKLPLCRMYLERAGASPISLSQLATGALSPDSKKFIVLSEIDSVPSSALDEPTNRPTVLRCLPDGRLLELGINKIHHSLPPLLRTQSGSIQDAHLSPSPPQLTTEVFCALFIMKTFLHGRSQESSSAYCRPGKL